MESEHDIRMVRRQREKLVKAFSWKIKDPLLRDRFLERADLREFDKLITTLADKINKDPESRQKEISAWFTIWDHPETGEKRLYINASADDGTKYKVLDFIKI